MAFPWSHATMVQRGFFVKIAILGIVCGLLSLAIPSNEKSVDDNEPLLLAQKKEQNANSEGLRWIIHNPILINTTETYDFATESRYDAYNTDRRLISPEFGNNNYYINESSFLLYACDTTGEVEILPPLDNLFTSSGLNSNGEAYFYARTDLRLNDHTRINEDSRILNDPDSYFYAASGNFSPTVEKGILLYRYGTTIDYTVWDHFIHLDELDSNPTLRIYIPAGNTVKIAILYEIDNYDDGWWIFQQHHYHHVAGIYQFNTTNA